MFAGNLDRRVQFWRADLSDDGFGSVETWAEYGDPVWSSKRDVSDGERYRAGEVSARLMTRFQVRWNELTATITPKDRLECEGRTFDIVGIKEIGRRVGLEITAAARAE